MKSLVKSAIALACISTAVTATAFCAAPPPDVVVTYAFVPKERLSDAVKGKREALAIEAAWRKEAMAKGGFPPYPLNLGNVKYSIVVFVEIPAKFALWGRIGIPVQNPKNPLIVNVNLSPGYSGTYVIDGGGIIFSRGIPTEPKPFEWLEIHTQ